MQPDFEIGDFVVWLPDGDVGLVIDIDRSREEEPFNIEWHLQPNQSGWHSAFNDRSDAKAPAMVRLGG